MIDDPLARLPQEGTALPRGYVRFVFACLLVVAAFFAMRLIIQWSAPSPRPPVAAELDRRIASEAVTLMKNALVNLPDDHDIVRRYGRLELVEIGPVERRSSQRGALDVKGFPACLQFECRCKFTKFSTPIGVVVLQGAKGSKPAFYSPDAPFDVQPTYKNAELGVLADCKPVMRDGRLYLVREGGDQVTVRCDVSCWINHPEFVP